MKHLIPALLAGFALVAAIPVGAAEPPAREPLVDQVRKAIEDAKKYLRETQRDKGDWDPDISWERISPQGGTALALLALLVAGEKPDSPTVQRGLEFLRGVPPSHTYTVGLQTMVFAEAGNPKDLLTIQKNVDWLIAGAIRKDGKITGWYYTPAGKRGDNSNTQYALLGLYAGKQAGAKIKREVWEEIQAYYRSTQLKDGGWCYVNGQQEPTLTMTTAGLCGLLMAGMEADAGRQLRPDGSDPQCGIYPANDNLARATASVADGFKIRDYTHYVYYNLYGLERAGRLSGQRFFGDHDWYREGCEDLTNPNSPIHQKGDGSFYIRGDTLYDRSPISCTSFALLFLAKGRTPILVSKLVHGIQSSNVIRWNNKHNDCRNLVEFASKEMFKKQPLGWQVFNARQSTAGNEELTGELLQSPIAYFNGHGPLHFLGKEEAILKLYVEQGGFLLVEDCCGDPTFDQTFRELMRKLWDEKDHPLRRLRGDHPIWAAWGGAVSPDNFPLEGMEFGCRTAIVYCPKPISGYWEINDRESQKGKEAFLLGGKIIAYATGMELPKPKLTKVDVPRESGETKVPRGAFKVAQLKHSNDRHSSNGVMRNLMLYLRNSARVDVAFQTQEMQPTDRDLLNYKFVYMHGRGNFEIDDLDLLRANLQTGGLLFADACCGKKPFDDSFRAFVKKLFPDQKLEPIPAEDELYGKDLNGSAIATVRCRRERGEAGYKDTGPALEGIKVDGRWVVIYSRYDIGCALEKHQSSDCLGYDQASALRLAGAAVLYALQK
jgi:Domain of unknown function (DUF4159)